MNFAGFSVIIGIALCNLSSGGGYRPMRPIFHPARMIGLIACLALVCTGGCTEQPDSAKTVAAYEIPLPTGADKTHFLEILTRAAEAYGLHVEGVTATGLDRMSRVSPVTFHATILRAEDDGEPIALAMDFRGHIGRVWLCFFRGEDPELGLRFRNALVPMIESAFPATLPLPVMSGGTIPSATDLVRTPSGYELDPSAAARYNDGE
ncbi:MAG: hypothetical protein PHS60_17535 [Zavarzinia sp.]|nr:hypothetical protein [Zavarzinia sp.]